MRLRYIVGAVLLTALCGACQMAEQRGAEYQLCFISAEGSADGAALGWESRTLAEETVEAGQLVEELLAGPVGEELLSPFPAGTVLRSCRVEEGVAEVDLSEAYGGLSGVDQTLADGCITLTLCQLEGIEAVHVTVEGAPRPFRDQILSPADLLTGNGEAPQGEQELLLWFPAGDHLGWEKRDVTLSLGDDPAVAALRALEAGPESRGFSRVCEEGETATLRSWGHSYALYLSAGWLAGEEEPLRLQAVAATLEELDPQAELVFILDGERLTGFGTLDLSEPLRGQRPDIPEEAEESS